MTLTFTLKITAGKQPIKVICESRAVNLKVIKLSNGFELTNVRIEKLVENLIGKQLKIWANEV